MRPRQTLASARRDGGPPRGVCRQPRPAGGGGAGGGLGDGATSRAGRRRAFEGSLPRAAGGLGPRSPAGRSRAVCGSRAPPDFRSVCSPIVPEADGAAVRERSRPARRTTARGGVHARRGTDVRPHGRPRFTRWVAGFVVTYGKDRDAGPGRRRVSPRSKAPGPTAPCPVGP